MKGTIEREIVALDVEKIDFDDKDLLKKLILMLLNRTELQAQEIQRLREEKQRLKDEIAHLKGEKGKPKVTTQVPMISISRRNLRKCSSATDYTRFFNLWPVDIVFCFGTSL